jgi:hypothetical protein
MEHIDRGTQREDPETSLAARIGDEGNRGGHARGR